MLGIVPLAPVRWRDNTGVVSRLRDAPSLISKKGIGLPQSGKLMEKKSRARRIRIDAAKLPTKASL